eukprot:3939026-Rhodomonas_salina.3
MVPALASMMLSVMLKSRRRADSAVDRCVHSLTWACCVWRGRAGNCINCMCHPTENIYSYRDTVPPLLSPSSARCTPSSPLANAHHLPNILRTSRQPTLWLCALSQAVARASDDFYPRENASHTVHVVNVVYNTLFLGEVVHPDWDMFQSEHPAASLHAAARAVGGCAVYTSDRPEIHNFDL